MCFWTLNGTSLEYHVGELTIVKAINNVGAGKVSVNANANMVKYGLALVCDELQQDQLGKQRMVDDELENVFVTFLSFLIITCLFHSLQGW